MSLASSRFWPPLLPVLIQGLGGEEDAQPIAAAAGKRRQTASAPGSCRLSSPRSVIKAWRGMEQDHEHVPTPPRDL